jgi:hypothetical protein
MTFEVTKESHLTERGDCIIGISASKAIRDLSDELKRLARSPEAKLTIEMEADGFREVSVGHGHSELAFSHRSDIVARKSRFVCTRTIMIAADKAAIDLSREFVKRLRDSKTRLEMKFTVEL